jgi:hypothetical protein
VLRLLVRLFLPPLQGGLHAVQRCGCLGLGERETGQKAPRESWAAWCGVGASTVAKCSHTITGCEKIPLANTLAKWPDREKRTPSPPRRAKNALEGRTPQRFR